MRALVGGAVLVLGLATFAPVGAGTPRSPSDPVTVDVTGSVAPGSEPIALSGDGRWVVHVRRSLPNVASVLDRWTGAITDLPDVDYEPPHGQSPLAFRSGAISDDGRWVVLAVNGRDTGGVLRTDAFLIDRVSGSVERISETMAGESAGAEGVSISDDGSLVAFTSPSDAVVPGDTNGARDGFVHHRDTGSVELVTRDVSGAPLTARSYAVLAGGGQHVLITTDDRTVASPDFLDGPRSGPTGVYVRRLTDGAVWKADWPVGRFSPPGPPVAVDPDAPTYGESISDDGRMVVFTQFLADGSQQQVLYFDDLHESFFLNLKPDGTLSSASSFSGVVSGTGNSVLFLSHAADIEDAVPFCRCLYRRHFGGLGFGAPELVNRSTHGSVGKLTGDAARAFSDDGSVAVWRDNVELAPGAGPHSAYWRQLDVPTEPFATLRQWAGQQVFDFEGRFPTKAESDEHTAALTQGRLFRGQLVDALAHGSFAKHRGPLARLYLAYFLRPPDAAGFAYWLGRLRSGRASLATVSAAFARSPEFEATYGDLPNDMFVDLVYQNVLQRPPDAGGRAYWVSRLDGGMSQSGLMLRFAESAEGRRRLAPGTDTVLVWLGMMRRPPTAATLFEWTRDIEGGTVLWRQIEKGLADTREYFERFA